MKIQSIRGMNDIFGSEMELWHEVENLARQISLAYGFKEFRTPVLEKTELFKRGVGEGTDVVQKEMYTFEDRNGESLTLRPEGTAPIVRAVVENSLLRDHPLMKLYYIGPMFRHERPQKGRYRQFHQYGAEVIGTDNPNADIELITLAHSFYQKLGLKNISLNLSSVGDENCRPAYREKLLKSIEPFKKDLPEEFQKRLEQNPLRIFDWKDKRAQEITPQLPKLIDHLNPECKKHLDFIQDGLAQLGVNYTLDPNIVRGLDYYTKTAFEFTSDNLGSQNAVGGGGRYDQLISHLGGKSTPAVGFGMGLERIVLILQEMNREASQTPFCYLVSADEPSRELIREWVFKLRNLNIYVESDIEDKSMKNQLKKANKFNAKYAIILGEAEKSQGKVIIKNMSTQEQKEIALNEMVDHIKSLWEEENV